MNPVSRFLARRSAEERTVFKRQLAAIFVIITLLNLGFYWQRAFREMAVRRNVQIVMRGWDGLAWYVWMLAAPATLVLIRRYPFVREQAVRSVVRLTVGSGAIYFVVTNTRYLLRVLPNLWLPPEADLPVSWSSYLNTQLERTPLDFLTYCGLFAASLAVDYYSKFRGRAEEVLLLQLRSAELQAELAKFQLTALRGQLQPHFLFNSFNAIATLVRQKKNDEAVETIAQLGELLRFVMEKFDQQELPLEQELEFIRCYLEVERVRFGDKLGVTLDVDPETLACIVPSLLLQPLVENAIKHGIAQRLAPGQVAITAGRHGDRLLIEVKNDGPEETAPLAVGRPSGIGLRNTRRRLEHVYGANHRFDVLPQPVGGMLVRLELPWQLAASAPRLQEGAAT
jgi:two-component system, LytTR family, sensor kinase